MDALNHDAMSLHEADDFSAHYEQSVYGDEITEFEREFNLGDFAGETGSSEFDLWSC